VEAVEEQHCLVRVVRPTAELEVLDSRRAAGAVGEDVMELEEPSFFAPAPAGGHEGAAPAVPQPDGALDLG
jgi:hypothetical protein